MHLRTIVLIAVLLVLGPTLWAQKGTGKSYRIDRYSSIYLPLGKISFADSIVSFTIGDPPPLEKYADPLQSLHEPNYKNYPVNFCP